MDAANDNEPTIETLSAALVEKLRAPIDPRDLPVRFSRLKLMALSPAHYYAACQRANDDGETLSMRLGAGVHAMLLDQPVTRFAGRRAGKVWEHFEREHSDKVILNEREWREAERMSVAILRHKQAAELLLDGTTLEQRLEWQYCGRLCSSTPDAYRPGSRIVELKTARSSRPRDFIRDAIRMSYHGQLAFYDDAVKHITGRGFPDAYVIAVENAPPHVVTIYRLTDRAMERARQTTRLWMEQLLACEAINHWPGYSELIVDLDVADEEQPIELEIDGQLTEVA